MVLTTFLIVNMIKQPFPLIFLVILVHQVVFFFFCVKSFSGSPLYDLLLFCNRKLVKCPGEREIRIFKLLSKYIKDPLLATKFVDILVPFITERAKNCGKNLS
jgi:hypothetical protein